MATASDLNPVPGGVLPADGAIGFRLEEVDADTVLISINNTVVYSNGVAHHGCTVDVLDDYYEVRKTAGWPYGVTLRVSVYGAIQAWWYRWFADGNAPLYGEPYGDGDDIGVIAGDWTLVVSDDPSCFIGPINAFETSLLTPLPSTTPQLEHLRTFILDNAIVHPQVNRAVRWLMLRAYSSPLSTVMRNIVPTPTATERAAKLCDQRSNVTMAQLLADRPIDVALAITELRSLGLPLPHARLLQEYNRPDPNVRVPLTCVMVCLAKALDVNAIS